MSEPVESLRRRINLLRARVHGEPGRPADPALVRELLDAETGFDAQMSAARAERAEGSHPDSKSTLVRLGATTTGIDAKVALRLPKVPTSIVHMFDADHSPLVTIDVSATRKVQRVRVTSYVDGYSARTKDTVEVNPGTRASIAQMPTFFPSAIRQVEEMTRATLHVEVDDLDSKSPELHRSLPIWLVPRTTAYLSMPDAITGKPVDFVRYLAAWVTPNAPAVMQVLRESATHHADHAIVGYQGPRESMEATVLAQARAIYAALRAREIRYVNSVLALGADGESFVQRVRLPRESLESRAANCIDGTVLMASLLEAASLNPAIVVIPGHAFVGVELGEQSGQWAYVETTMLGSHDFDDALKSGMDTAAIYQKANAGRRGQSFQRHELSQLRQDGVIPME